MNYDILKSSNLKGLVSDYGELGLDELIEDGILRDAPIIGTFIKSLGFIGELQKGIFTKKLYQFLLEIKDIPPSEREKLINKIDESGKYGSKVGETVLEVIDKIDLEYKPKVLGKLFKAVLREDITYDEYLRLSHIVRATFYQTLEEFREIVSNDKDYITIPDELAIVHGITDTDFKSSYEESKNGELPSNHTVLTDIGGKLFQYGLK